MLIEFRTRTAADIHELAPHAVAVVPLGSNEQHGPHLPVGTDTIIVNAVVAAAAEKAAAACVVLPAIEFGFAHHHLPFGGTISLEMTHYSDLLTDVGVSLAASGFRSVAFVNGHGGNDSPMREAIDRIVFEREADIHVAGASYWDAAASELEAFADRGLIPGHAGWFETSCVMSIRPELVHWERAPQTRDRSPRPLALSGIPGAVVRRPGVWQASDGRTDDGLAANAEAGDAMLDALATGVARLLGTLYESVR